MSNRTKQKRRDKSGKSRTPIKPRSSLLLSQTTFGHLVAWFEHTIKAQHHDADQEGDATINAPFGSTKVTVWIETATDSAEIYNIRALGAELPWQKLDQVKRALKKGVLLPQATYENAHKELCDIMAAIGRLKIKEQIGLGEAVKGRAIYEEIAEQKVDGWAA